MRLNHRYIVPDFYTGIKKQTTNDRFLTVLGSLYAGSPQINISSLNRSVRVLFYAFPVDGGEIVPHGNGADALLVIAGNLGLGAFIAAPFPRDRKSVV